MGSVYRRKIIPVCVFLLFGVVSQLLSNCCLRCLKPPTKRSRAYIKVSRAYCRRALSLCAPIVGARSLRAWGARFLRAWGGRFLRAWCGECFFQARPSRWVFLLCFALPWFMAKTALHCNIVVHANVLGCASFQHPKSHLLPPPFILLSVPISSTEIL